MKELVSSHMGWPNGLTVDMELDHIYWVDALHDTVEVANIDGTERYKMDNSQVTK